MTLYQEMIREFERDVIKTFQEGILDGKPQEQVAKITGIHRTTYNKYLDKHPDLKLVYVEEKTPPRSSQPLFKYNPYAVG